MVIKRSYMNVSYACTKNKPPSHITHAKQIVVLNIRVSLRERERKKGSCKNFVSYDENVI
jgi:hypothetical protein